MKNHNSHIILESSSSQIHKYENDGNGNIKVDTNGNGNSPYNIFVQQNKKLDIKDILHENNNLFINEFEKNILSEEIPSSPNKDKKKKIVIKSELSTKEGSYRFDINKIKPCFNEIDLKYNRDFDPDFSYEIEDRQNNSFELDDKKDKIDNDIINKNKKIRMCSAVCMINYGKKTKKLQEYKEKEKKINENNSNNDKISDLTLLKDIIENNEKLNNSNYSNQDNNEENYNNVNNKMNNEEEKLNQKSSEHSESNINLEENKEQISLIFKAESSNPNLDENIKDNSEQNNQSDINNSEESSKDKFLEDQELPQNIDKENNDINNIIKPKIMDKYMQKNNFRRTQPNSGDILKRFKEKNENKAIKINEVNTVRNLDIKYLDRKNEMEQGNNNININNNTDREKLQNISQTEKNDKIDGSILNIDKESDIKLLKEKIIYTENENEKINDEYININNNLNNDNIILKSNPQNAQSENIITTNINNESNNEIKNNLTIENEEEKNDIFDEFKQPLEENPLNSSYKTEPKKSKVINRDENNKERNTISYGFNNKKKNKNININQNSDKNLDVHSPNGNRDNNPQNNQDIQNNNTEINCNNNNKLENEEINKADEENIILNSQKSKELDLPIEENKGDNIFNNNANKSKSNNIINNFDNNTREKIDINSNINTNNNENNKQEFKNIIENNPNSVINNNIASNSNNYINQKMNLSFELCKNLQNEDLNNNLNLVNKNSKNIFINNNNISLQNISNIKKNDQLENDDNIPLLLNKINENENENQINDNANINSTRSLQQNNLEQNNNYIMNNEGKISLENNEEVKGENNIARSENDNAPIFTQLIKDKSNEENNIFDDEEEKERIDTEEFLENNLEKSQNDNIDINDNNNQSKSNNSKNNTNDNNINSKYISDESDSDNDNESKRSKYERIFMKQILPVSYIYKTRHKEITINKLIKKKKRVFITKIKGSKKQKEILLPQTSICLMTNQYIIPKKYQLFIPVINKNFFLTKLTTNNSTKDKIDEIEITLHKNNMPKVYKRTKISSGKKNFYYIKRNKKNKNKDFENIIIIDKRGRSVDININKDKNKNKNKTEKIIVVSKDKEIEIDDNTSSKADDNNNNIIINNNIDNKIKGRNIIIKKDNKILHQFVDDGSNNNDIDITVQLSNEKPKDLLHGTSLRKFPSTTKNKIIKKFVKESLYDDLKEIKNKLRNKNDHFKMHYHANFQKHVGDMSTCPVCLEIKKKGIHAEREKGLLKILNSRNLKNINGRNKPKMNILLNRNEKENNKSLNIFGSNNNNIRDVFNDKYLQFNEFNRLNRYGSFENLFIYSNDNIKRNTRKINLFKSKEMDKNKDDFDRWNFSALGQYFKKLY